MTGLKNDKSHLCPLHSTAAAIANYVLLLVVGFLTGTNNTNTMVPIYDCIPHRRPPFFGASKYS